MFLSELYDQLSEREPEFGALMERSKPRVALALNLVRLRTEKGFTQEALARAAGMRQPRIAEIERGDANPRLETIARLAAALGVDTGELITLREPLFQAPAVSEAAQSAAA